MALSKRKDYRLDALTETALALYKKDKFLTNESEITRQALRLLLDATGHMEKARKLMEGKKKK